MPNEKLSQYQAAAKKRRLLSGALGLIGIPAVLFIGTKLIDRKMYLPVSLMILFLTMVPFAMVFERRRPKAREIVLLAMMTAITVLANLVCSVGIPLHAGTALVIISGIALGPEAGFLIGALSRLICNFFQGQGPWTPWEMFCWGLLGFLGGIVFSKVDIQKMRSRSFRVIVGPILCVLMAWILAYLFWLIFAKPGESFFGWRLYVFGLIGLLAGILLQRKRMPVDDWTISIFTFLTVFIVYGGIMNFASMVTTGLVDHGTSTLKILYISGVPYDLIHAGGAAFCCFLFGEKMIRKLERVKIKFGIYR